MAYKIINQREEEAWSERSTTPPSVSIIIPTTRPTQVQATLATLLTQHYDGHIEIILVGAGVTALQQQWPVHVVDCEITREPGRARNTGASHAQGTVLLFLDDDCLVAQDWVERNVRALAEPRVGIVGARIQGVSPRFFARCHDFTNFGAYQPPVTREIAVASASMGIRRRLFEQIGGFDAEMRSGEDMELCARVQQAGYRTLYQPAIIVRHHHGRQSLRHFLHYNYQHGRWKGLHSNSSFSSAHWQQVCLTHLHTPTLYLGCIPVFALLATVRLVQLNVRSTPHVLLYAPFMLLGKLAYQLGIFVHLVREGKH